MPETQDIAPALYDKIRAIFNNKLENDKRIKKIAEKMVNGTATHADTQEYAILIGDHAAAALMAVLVPESLPEGRLWFNIAERTVRPVLENNRELVNTAADYVQDSLNKSTGIGIKPVIPAGNTDRIDGIVDKLSNSELLDDVKWVLDEPIKNCTQSFADDFMKANFETQSRAGLRPRIVRTVAGGCCKWCRDLAGTYDYDNLPDDVYRRHERCRCLVVFEADRVKQNVHTKKWYDKEGTALARSKLLGAEQTLTVTERAALVEEKKRVEKVAKEKRISEYMAKYDVSHRRAANRTTRSGG